MRFYVQVGSLRAERIKGRLGGWNIRTVDVRDGMNVGWAVKHGRSSWTGRFNYERMFWYRARSISQLLRRMAIARGDDKSTLQVKVGNEPIPQVVLKTRRIILEAMKAKGHADDASDLRSEIGNPKLDFIKPLRNVFYDEFENLHNMGFLETDYKNGGLKLSCKGEMHLR